MGGPGKSYHLGIDLGTTYTAAAVWRGGQVEMASLGNRAPSVPSVLLLRDDGEFLCGEAADHRAASEPHRVAREFKRRVGDPTPLIVDKTPFAADALMTKLLRWVVDSVSEAEGGPPSAVAITHPANWGDYKQDLLRQALRAADLEDATLLTEPEAAAIHYATQERIDPGSIVALYDLGGGTFDAAVLQRTEEGWEIRGQPEGIERLGGIDFDEAVFRHVVEATGTTDELDNDDPTLRGAVHRLRRDCVAAKEVLSSDTDTSIPVLLPQLQSLVRLTRSEFEDMIRPTLRDTIAALDRSLRSAEVASDQVHAVLLAGGSSRIPLVAELISSEFGRPVAVDAHPKHGVALGAAIVAAERSEAPGEEAKGDGGERPGVGPAAGAGALLAALPGHDDGNSSDSGEPTAATPEPVAHTEAADLPETGATEPPTTEMAAAAEPEVVPPPTDEPGSADTQPTELPTPADGIPSSHATDDLPPLLADPTTQGSGRRMPPVGALVAVALVLVVIAAVALLTTRDDDPGDRAAALEGTTTTTTAPGLEVPDVLGMPIDDARERLAEDGFTVSVSSEATSDSALVDLVARQDPPAGTTLGAGDTDVELVAYEYEPDDTDDGATPPPATSPPLPGNTTPPPPATQPHTTTTTEPPPTTTTAPPTTTTAPPPGDLTT